MLLDLETIDAPGRALDVSIALPELNGEDGAPRVRGPVRLRGRAWRGPRGVMLEARLEGAAELECSRCLERFAWPLDLRFSLRLVPRSAPEQPGDEGADTDEDPDVVAVAGTRAELRGVASEQVYLAVPLKPLCRDDCRGLCPTCGAHRNRIECACPEPDPDPRLSPLREIRKRIGGA